MKPICVASFIILISFSAYCDFPLKQDFEGSIFPPTGWSIETGGTGPYWSASWSRVTYSGSQWAYGSAVAGEGSGLSTADAKMFTPIGSLSQGDRLAIRFIFFGEISPPVAVQNYLKVSLFNGTNEVWNYSMMAGQIPSSPTMIKLVTNSVTTSSGNYRVCWWLYAVGGATLMQTWSKMHLDNILIVGVTPGRNEISPATLGQLKAVYAR